MARRPALLICVLVLLAAFAAPAEATHVSCGDAITQDTTLDSDLVDCPGDGVVIGASGITLDLGGHTIDGTGTSGTRGVNNMSGHDGLVLTNGTIREFRIAVDLSQQQGGEVSRLAADEAIVLRDSPDIRIERNVAGGIQLIGDCDRVRVTRNEVDDAVIAAGGFLAVGSTQLPFVFPDDVVVDRNTIRPFLYLHAAPRASATRNQVLGSPSDDFFAGIAVDGGGPGGPVTLIERNEVSGDTTGIVTNRTPVILTRNVVSDNTADGIAVVNDANALIDRNRAEHNGDDGIDVDVTSATISNNFANFNADLGIEAVAGVTDGGGNKAAGNGNPAQCLNVSCE